MAAIVFTKFSGVAPRLTKWRLPPEMAQVATNLNLESRTLRPWKGLLDIETGLSDQDPSTIYRFGLNVVSDTQYWFHWAGKDVDVVKGPVVGDVTERTFYTGDGAPKWTNNTLALTAPPYPAAYRDLGVTAPTGAPTVNVTGAGTGTPDNRAYVYTNITVYGEESAPSPASSIVEVQSGQTVEILGFTAAPGGNGSTTARRIYRSVSSPSGTTAYFFVKEIPVATSSTNDDVGDSIGEPIASSDWVAPPSTMFGLTAMANGVLVGFNGNDVCLSEAYVPYAWPVAYRLSTDFPIVGGKAIGNQTVVLTTGNPYLLTGTAPESMSLTKLEWPFGCVSKRSIVCVGGGVIYASPVGLCLVDGSGQVTNITEPLLTAEQWAELNPESLRAYLYNGQYFGFYDTGSVQAGFILEPREAEAALSYLDSFATAGYTDPVQNELYLKIDTKIQKWDETGAYTDYTWRSGVVTLDQPRNFSVGQVSAAAYPVTLNLYADGVLKHTQAVANGSPFRLPSGFLGAEYEVELTGTNEVYKAVIASTVAELKEV